MKRRRISGAAFRFPVPLQSDIKGRVHEVHIFLIQLLPEQLDSLTEALEVNHLTLPEEFDHVVHIRVIGQPQNVVVGNPGFLLWHAQSFATK